MCNEIWVCLLRSSWSKPATNKKATRPLQSHQHISHHSVTSYWDPPKKSQPEKRGHDWEKFVLIEHENDNRLIPKVYLEPNTFQELCTPCKDVLVVKLFEEKPHSTLFLASLLWLGGIGISRVSTMRLGPHPTLSLTSIIQLIPLFQPSIMKTRQPLSTVLSNGIATITWVSFLM